MNIYVISIKEKIGYGFKREGGGIQGGLEEGKGKGE